MYLSDGEYKRLKQIVHDWIISIDEDEELPKGITALNFGLFEPYGIELISANVYDAENDDWACEENFVPDQRECPDFDVEEDISWEEFLSDIVQMLKELTEELKDLKILQVKHITTGFCDGDLVVVK